MNILWILIKNRPNITSGRNELTDKMSITLAKTIKISVQVRLKSDSSCAINIFRIVVPKRDFFRI